MDEGLQMPNWYFELKEAAAVVTLSRTGIGLLGIICYFVFPHFCMYEVARQLFL